jgi:hypothetical protein
MASTYLSRTPASAGNRKTWTLSGWYKFADNSTVNTFLSAGSADGDRTILIRNGSTNGDLRFLLNGSGDYVISQNYLRDLSAWYHIVFSVDTTQATASNRVKIYINGIQVTSFSTEIYPTQNTDLNINNNTLHTIGKYSYTSAGYYDGSMAHVHFIDGTAYDASAFGETDATTGIWKPKTTPVVTYGTNGFFLKFENSASFGTDSSPNGNNFTVNGTMTQTIDTPSNVFATLNPLTLQSNSITLSNGNTKATTSAAPWRTTNSTIGVSSGKWYFECKAINTSASAYLILGIQSDNLINNATSYIGDAFYSYGYKLFTGQLVHNENNGGGNTSWGSTVSNNQIVGVAVDLTNSKLYFSINGVWQNSGDPTSGATGTGGFSIQSGETYFAGLAMGDNGANPTAELNFGNGYFGTTPVSSAQNPDDGIGIFEYEVPAGYKALCTKSINAQEYS